MAIVISSVMACIFFSECLGFATHSCNSGSRVTLIPISMSKKIKKKSDKPVTIELISPPNQYVERSLYVLGYQIHPYWIITAAEPRTTEVVWIDTGAEAVALL